MLTQREKERVITKHKVHKSDTGSSEVQIALLSEEIRRLTLHLKTHSKDHSSRRGLLKMVARRKKLLDFLKKDSEKRYNKVVKALSLS